MVTSFASRVLASCAAAGLGGGLQCRGLMLCELFECDLLQACRFTFSYGVVLASLVCSSLVMTSPRTSVRQSQGSGELRAFN